MPGGENETSHPEHRLLAKFSVYGAGSVVGLLASLSLLPIYAAFDPVELGLLATAQAVLSILGSLTRLGLPIAMFRFVAGVPRDARPDATQLIATCFWVNIGVASISACGLVLVSHLYVFGFNPRWTAVLDLLALTLVAAIPRETAEIYLRATARARSFVVLSGLYLVLSTLLVFLVVLRLRGGVESVLAAYLVANLVSGAVALVGLARYLRPAAVSGATFLRELRYGAIGVPSQLGDWVTQYSDRFFLAPLAGLGQVGVYSFGYRIGQLEQQVLGVAAQAAWDPFAISQHSRSDAPQLLGRIATYLLLLGMFVAVELSASTPLLLAVVRARPEYSAAGAIVFLVALANLFGIARHLFLTPTSIRVRPAWSLAVWLSAIAVNVALNAALIPPFGMLGAAWSTVLTLGSSAMLAQFGARHLWTIHFEWTRLARIAFAGGVSHVAVASDFAGALVLAPPWMPVVAGVVFLSVLALTGFGTAAEWTRLRAVGDYIVRTSRTSGSNR